ncbi:MAG: hypothetical protein JXJ04_03795 [Spirochaetales bacterium]|nr:hypothetical protein [Spirochaetales bacterium]
MKNIIFFNCSLLIFFSIIGCNTPDKEKPETYSATIAVVNNDSEEYRLYIGLNDNLYNAETLLTSLPDGEIVIPSISGGTTETYELDLGTNPSLAKDWILEVADPFFEGEWSIVLCTIDTDADGYNFEGNESYTITIESTSNISIQMDT